MRITSLYPTATEIAFAVGAGDEVVGVSHACDYPAEAKERKAVTRARFDPAELSSGEIYRQKVEMNRRFGSVYRLDETALWGLRSDALLTQGPGDFSLVSLQGVRAIAEGLNPRPELTILYPRHLDDVLDDHARVGFAVGHLAEARELVGRMRDRLSAVEERRQGKRHRSVAFIQWLDPSFSGGYWIPQLIQIAGGRDAFNRAGLSPSRVRWPDLKRRNPEVIVIACEDLGLERIREEMVLLTERPGWHELLAVRRGGVFLGAGPVFTRAGPRIVDGVEALAWAINPDLFPKPPPDVLQKYGY